MLTFERLKSVLNYTPETGLFTWIARQSVNSRAVIGSVAGYKDFEGYITIRIDEKSYKAHRLAWLYSYGEWPKQQIDHINKIRSDNRLSNLRDVSSRQKNCNRTTNTSGYPGVSWHKEAKRWRATIYVNGSRYHLGLFIDPVDASLAYDDAAEKVCLGEFVPPQEELIHG